MNHVDVAVIGGGFSAAATIVNLTEVLGPGQAIGVVGRTAGLGLGTAYGRADDVHRLNVPAGRMSLFPDEPEHLCNWLGRNGHPHGPEDFIPRPLFGVYVQDALGPMTTGQFFEIFAVPDIRVQTKQVAGRIADKIPATKG